MNFPDIIAKEHSNEWGDKTGWRMEITPAPEQLILHSWQLDNGTEKYPSSCSVLASDVDPESVFVQEAFEEHELNHLHANCIYYQDAIVSKRAYDPTFHLNNVALRYPLAKEVSDLEAAKKCFQDFLRKCGARPPVINLAAIEEFLPPLRAALEPARCTVQHDKAGKPELIQSAEIDSRKMHLVRRTQQPGGAHFDLDTYELLSLDLASVDVSEATYEPGLWVTSLYSVEHLSTRITYNDGGSEGYEMWYEKVVFQTEADARHFADTCVRTVGAIRERLYQLHRAAAL